MMLEQHAVVLRTEGDQAWVEARESGTCGSCGTGGCSTRRLADLFGRNERAFPVSNVLQAPAGERVVIGIPGGALWKSAVRLYGLPLLLMLAGALTGQSMQGDVGAGAGLLAGLMLSILLQKIWPASQAWRPVMLRRADEFKLFKSC
jgi:sigma-E factor negative regulatory protein RseC